MAKLKRRRSFRRRVRAYRRPRMTVPLSILLGMAPVVASGIEGFQVGGFSANGLKIAANNMSQRLIGWDAVGGHFTPGLLKQGLFPLLGGMLAHKLLGGSLGLNRFLGRAGVPLIRI